MATDINRIGIPEVICPVCGKTYIRAPYHLYKDAQKRYVCSWGCMLESERMADAKAKARAEARRAQRKAAGSMSKKAAARERARERMRAEREERAERDRQIFSAFESGVSVGDIAEQFGLSLSRTKQIISASR